MPGRRCRPFASRYPLPILLAGLAAALLACGGGEPSPEAPAPAAPAEETSVVVYSGRSESLIGPLLERFEAATGVRTEVRYGNTAEMAATLLEEGARSPSDLFLGQDAAALGALSAAGLLRPIPAALLERVAPAFRGPDGDWIGLSGRARTVVYNTERIAEDALPQSLEALGEARYRGRFGVAPANASFQAHMAVYHALHGREALRALLDAMVANQPQRYPKNSAIVEATIRGEIDFGLVNHYYLWRALAEQPEAPARNFTMPDATGSFINLAGAGLISERPAAVQLLEYLLAEDAQHYFAAETFEYPLAAGVTPAVELAPLDAAALDAQVDFARASALLEETLEEIAASGLLQ